MTEELQQDRDTLRQKLKKAATIQRQDYPFSKNKTELFEVIDITGEVIGRVTRWKAHVLGIRHTAVAIRVGFGHRPIGRRVSTAARALRLGI